MSLMMWVSGEWNEMRKSLVVVSNIFCACEQFFLPTENSAILSEIVQHNTTSASSSCLCVRK